MGKSIKWHMRSRLWLAWAGLLLVERSLGDCCNSQCNSCYLRLTQNAENTTRLTIPDNCHVYTGQCGSTWFQEKEEQKWCDDQDACYAEHSDDCCNAKNSAVFWTVFLLLAICGGCGALACCFFCESCPLSQYYLEAEDSS